MEKEHQEEQLNNGLLAPHIFFAEEIVIGGNLNAYIYANEKNTHIIHNTLDNVYSYDTNSFGYDLGIGSPFEEGSKTEDLLDALSYKLAFTGKAPFADKVSSIRLEDNKTLKVTTHNARVFRVKYNKLRIFDTTNVFDLPFLPEKVTKGFRVFDWFDVQHGTKHEFDLLEDDSSNLVNKIRFYISSRAVNECPLKDLVAESYLTSQQLRDPEYSDTFARLKVLSMMKEAGITGPLNGKDRYGNIRHRPLKISLNNREVIPDTEIKSMECGDIIIDGRSTEEILPKRS